MSVQEVPAEEARQIFVLLSPFLSPYFGCKETSHAEPWTKVPDCVRKQLVAAAQLALMELHAEERENDDFEAEDRRRYFARPGSAQWGC